MMRAMPAAQSLAWCAFQHCYQPHICACSIRMWSHPPPTASYYWTSDREDAGEVFWSAVSIIFFLLLLRRPVKQGSRRVRISGWLGMQVAANQ
jgi:hypothetical protein